MTFAQLRATTLWLKAQREAGTVGEGRADNAARVQRRELRATLSLQIELGGGRSRRMLPVAVATPKTG
jgi:hypothetical protein